MSDVLKWSISFNIVLQSDIYISVVYYMINVND